MSRDLRAFAAELLEQHERDFERSAAALIKLMQEDVELRHAIALDWLTRLAPAPLHSRRRPGPHRIPAKKRRTMPTKEQKAAALRTEIKTAANLVFERRMRGGRLLGDIRCSELAALAGRSADICAQFLKRGHEDGVDAVGLGLLAKHLAEHVTVTDPFATIRDVVKPTIVTKIFEAAKIKAAEMIRDASDELVRRLQSGGEEPRIEQ